MAATTTSLDAIVQKQQEKIGDIAWEIGLEFEPRCHPKAGLRVRYRTPEVYVTCKRCGAAIIELALASQESPR